MTSNPADKTHLGMQELIALLAIASIVLHLIFRFLFPLHAELSLYPLYVCLGLGGIPLIYELLKKLFSFEFGSDLLAGISIATAIWLQEYLAGSFVVLMLSGGQSIEKYAMREASKVLNALAKRAPTVAHRKLDLNWQDIPVQEIAVGDILQVLPHEICPVDGSVIEGRGVMDESYLTGEPFLISKVRGSDVLSGAINGDDSLIIKAAKLAVDSRYEKIMAVMKETEQKRPKIRRLSDQLGALYTPIAIAISLLAWFYSGDPVRFLAVLVVATPCPLLIAIPVAIIGSISLSAKRGILIKNPAVLEQFDRCRTMIFDKTGTLTYGMPTLTDMQSYHGHDIKEVLKWVASIERYSKHPLASAIVSKALEQGIPYEDVSRISEPKGKGLKGIVAGHEIFITSRKELVRMGLVNEAEMLPKGLGLECVILIDGKLAAYYRFRDEPREDSEAFIHHLPPMHGFKKVMIVSGDRKEEVDYLAERVGITEVFAGQSPEQKVEIVSNETKQAKTAYLGDGINDAPALIAATVGIAFGQNSDITAEAAGAVVMDSSLSKVDEFLHISRRMLQIGLQSAIGGMLLSLIAMGVAAFGYLPPVAGAITQEVIDVLTIFNSLRALAMPSKLTDMNI